MRAAAAIDPRNRITHKNRPQKELSLPFEAGLLFFAGGGEAGEEKERERRLAAAFPPCPAALTSL